jgi:hypothetical protein
LLYLNLTKERNMKPEYLEPFKRIYPTKSELLTAWSDWFESKSDEWDLFTLTVVFKAGGKVPRPDRWESEFKNRVLLKVRRALERNKKNYDFAIPFDDFCYYEFDETSIFRISGSRKPHHVHALIPIRKSSVYRFWSIDDNDLQSRLIKDIYSIDMVGSILVEPIKEGRTRDWISYCLKNKNI